MRKLLLKGMVLAPLFLCSCATPITEFERVEHEQLRAEYWPLFLRACEENGGYIYMKNPSRHCRDLEKCLPRPVEWDFREVEFPNGTIRIIPVSATYQCFK